MFKKRMRLFCKELVLYFLAIFSPIPKDQHKVVIFAQGRSGSTLLEDLLESTGHFKSHGEKLKGHNANVFFPYLYINGLAKYHNKQSFIFHLKIRHLVKDRKKAADPAQFLEKLERQGWKIIYLQRRNKVRQALSNVLADVNNRYHKYDGEDNRFNVDLNIHSFEKLVDTKLSYDRLEPELLTNRQYFEVVYEDDLINSDRHQSTIDDILNYLQLESRPVITKLKKINTLPTKEVVNNYEELVTLLDQNRWSHYLD